MNVVLPIALRTRDRDAAQRAMSRCAESVAFTLPFACTLSHTAKRGMFAGLFGSGQGLVVQRVPDLRVTTEHPTFVPLPAEAVWLEHRGCRAGTGTKGADSARPTFVPVRAAAGRIRGRSGPKTKMTPASSSESAKSSSFYGLRPPSAVCSLPFISYRKELSVKIVTPAAPQGRFKSFADLAAAMQRADQAAAAKLRQGAKS